MKNKTAKITIINKIAGLSLEPDEGEDDNGVDSGGGGRRNSLELRLKSQNDCSVIKEAGVRGQPGELPRSNALERLSNSSPNALTRKMNEAKRSAEDSGMKKYIGRGAFRLYKWPVS